ncbi:hypothetical protein ACFYOV_17595 [Streptomyces sp. NPDC005931]|uniref:hypothetical protein n=1 Tax=Streptomyces sp. NPDC005931 TaxID=3364737 RepID=UPI0036786A5A
MLFLGLLLVAATAAFTGLVIADNLSGGPEYAVSLFDRDIATLNTLAVFCAGLALALLFCLGLATAVNGAAHHHRRSRRRPHRRSHRRSEADAETTPLDELMGPDPRA